MVLSNAHYEELGRLLDNPPRSLIYSARLRSDMLDLFERIGQPVKDAGCPTCLYDAISSAKKLYKMEKRKRRNTPKAPNYVFRNIAVVWKGQRLEAEDVTPEIAAQIVAEAPEKAAKWFLVLPPAELPKTE